MPTGQLRHACNSCAVEYTPQHPRLGYVTLPVCKVYYHAGSQDKQFGSIPGADGTLGNACRQCLVLLGLGFLWLRGPALSNSSGTHTFASCTAVQMDTNQGAVNFSTWMGAVRAQALKACKSEEALRLVDDALLAVPRPPAVETSPIKAILSVAPEGQQADESQPEAECTPTEAGVGSGHGI